MVKTITKTILKRVGSAAAVALLARGVPAETVEQIVVGITALALVLVDVGAEYLDQKRERR